MWTYFNVEEDPLIIGLVNFDFCDKPTTARIPKKDRGENLVNFIFGSLEFSALNYDFHHISNLTDAKELTDSVVSNIDDPKLFEPTVTLHRCRKDNETERAIEKHFLFE